VGEARPGDRLADQADGILAALAALIEAMYPVSVHRQDASRLVVEAGGVAVAELDFRLLERVETLAPEPGVADVADSVLEQAIAATGVPVSLMAKRHKLAVVADLKQRGFFNLRESAERAGRALGVTRYTIYNYLKEIEN
jgi:hypothetical protein